MQGNECPHSGSTDELLNAVPSTAAIQQGMGCNIKESRLLRSLLLLARRIEDYQAERDLAAEEVSHG